MARFLNPSEIGRPEQEGLRHWSPTGLEGVIECARRRRLRQKFKKKLTWSDFAKGTHIHRKIEELRLNHLREKSRYNSAEAYANVVANDWQRGPIKEGKIRGDKIIWADEKQPYIMKNEIQEICKRIYPILMEEQIKNPPIIFTDLTKKGEIKYKTSYDFQLVYKGRGFSGEIDEMRKEGGKIIIRDYKTGKWKYIEEKLNYAFQPTEYKFVACLLCIKDENFRKALEITKEQAETLVESPECISENIIFEYFMLDKPKEWDKEKKEFVEVKKDPIIRIERTDFHYKELCQNIDIANTMLSDMQDQAFYPAFRGYHCKRCFYQEECDDMTRNADVNIRQSLLPTYLQYMNERPKKFNQTNVTYEKLGMSQAEFNFMKEVKKSNKKL